MQRANAGLYESYAKAEKEVRRTKKKLCEVAQKAEEKCQIAIGRVKVRLRFNLCVCVRSNILFTFRTNVRVKSKSFWNRVNSRWRKKSLLQLMK
jgi:hypothetical protein